MPRELKDQCRTCSEGQYHESQDQWIDKSAAKKPGVTSADVFWPLVLVLVGVAALANTLLRRD